MSKITFCIASANNERDYTLLALESLKRHTRLHDHEVLVFIDSDNQNTYEALLALQQREYSMMRIYKNELGYPVGSQRNVSMMFAAATNDIVCYLQSDMVVGANVDTHIIDALQEYPTAIVSLTRIEPPLHPASPEKIVYDLGLTPDQFKWNEFNELVSRIQSENKPIGIDAYFAPFALHKSSWIGFDPKFRVSREDSDFILRAKGLAIPMIQSWQANVYHFTCVSSRGKDWYKQTTSSKRVTDLQKLADIESLNYFIRKWGMFSHDLSPKYRICLSIECDTAVEVTNIELMSAVSIFADTLKLDNDHVANCVIDMLNFKQTYYANSRLSYSSDNWLDNFDELGIDFKRDKIVVFDPQLLPNSSYSVNVSAKLSEILRNTPESFEILSKLQALVDQNDTGEYEIGVFSVYIHDKTDVASDLYKVLAPVIPDYVQFV